MVNKNSIKVMIVDDSSFARDIIATILTADPDIVITGTAIDGQDALDKVMDLQPDLITMDIVMPRMGGLEAIEHIMAFCPTPILCVTSQQDAHIAFQALSKGALEVVEKPSFETMGISRNQKEFIDKVKLLAKVRVITHLSGRHARRQDKIIRKQPVAVDKIIGIGSSTGGPKVLAKILGLLPTNLGVAIIIVQHIAEGFGKSLVDWLNSVSQIDVKLARTSDRIAPGSIYIAPTGSHLEFSQRGIINLTDKPKEEGQRPSASIMLRSMAKFYGRNALGIILTGMGRDGAAGVAEIKTKGGQTIAQNKDSCAVFGMPKAAIELGVVDKVLPLDAIVDEIVRFAE